MNVYDQRIDEFIDLWQRAFGERITRDNARLRARQLVELYRAISEDVALRDPRVAPPPAESSGVAPAPGGGS